MPENDAELQLYLQRAVGRHGRVEITSVRRFDSWAELPWGNDDSVKPPDPMPDGKALLIGVRNQLTLRPGEESFVVLGDGEPLNVAGNLAGVIIRAVGGFTAHNRAERRHPTRQN